jgi:hypothetical protein
MIESLSSLFESSLDFPNERLHIVPSQSSAPWFASIVEPYRGDSATFYHFTLLGLVYRLF